MKDAETGGHQLCYSLLLMVPPPRFLPTSPIKRSTAKEPGSIVAKLSGQDFDEVLEFLVDFRGLGDSL